MYVMQTRYLSFVNVSLGNIIDHNTLICIIILYYVPSTGLELACNQSSCREIPLKRDSWLLTWLQVGCSPKAGIRIWSTVYNFHVHISLFISCQGIVLIMLICSSSMVWYRQKQLDSVLYQKLQKQVENDTL